MDNQNNKNEIAKVLSTPQTTSPVKPSTVSNNLQPNKSNIDVSDIDAKALLAIQNFQTTQPTQKHGSKMVVISLVMLVLLALIGYFIAAEKPASSSNNSNSSHGVGIPDQSNNFTGNGTTNQINNDVNSCSNPVNAVTTC